MVELRSYLFILYIGIYGSGLVVSALSFAETSQAMWELPLFPSHRVV